MQLRGVSVHHGVPVLRHAPAQAGAQAREGRHAARPPPPRAPEAEPAAARRDPRRPRRPPALRDDPAGARLRRGRAVLPGGARNIVYLPDLVATSPLHGDYYKLVTQLFVYYLSTGYEVAALSAIFLFGWLLERRHGAWAPLLVFFVGGVAGSALVLALDPHGGTMGGNSAALALLAAWTMAHNRCGRHPRLR